MDYYRSESQLSAEAYLGILYPEMQNKWTANHKGLFFRNYSTDIMSLNVEKALVSLSRDGWLRYFPEDLISPEDEISKKAKGSKHRKTDISSIDKKIHERVTLLHESFIPFDTFRFRANLMLEKKIEEILSIKISYILKEYFNFDMESVHDPYVKKAAMLLPYISKLRGNVRFVKSLLETITAHKVEMHISTYGHTDHTVCAIRKVFYDVVIDGLTSETYEQEQKKLQPLSDFIIDRFILLEMLCVIRIKGVVSDEPLLDYNYCI